MQIKTKDITKCYHCGDDCIDEVIELDQKSFCCFGCKAVYELLELNDLSAYYRNTDLRPSKVIESDLSKRKYAFLDLPDVSEKLIRFQDDQKTIVKLYLSGIHCSSCIYLLEHLPKLNEAVIKAEVNFIRKELIITFDHTNLSLKNLALLLSRIGYPPTINLDSLEKEKGKTNASIGIKIAVAGFCFGNSMLISLPEYLDVGFQLEKTFKDLFGWINMLLALPVVFYAALDYFRSSMKSLRYFHLSIDVPIALGILTLFLRSFYEIISQTGPGYIDSLSGLVFFLLVGKWYQSKTYQALAFDRDYKSYFPISVTRIKEGREEVVLIRNLNIGDTIVIHNNELVPADVVVESGKGSIDYSFVTGESQPVDRSNGEKVFAGGRQMGGQIKVKLLRAVDNSELTQLWNQQSEDKSDLGYHSLIDNVSKYFTLVIIFLALGTGIYWKIIEPDKVWDAVTAVLIIACPCALALTVPFAFGHSMRIMGRKGLYLKNAQVIEKLAKIKTIVFDKTGTLTQNDQSRISFSGDPLSSEELTLVRTTVSNSMHPLNRMIASFLPDGEKVGVLGFEELVGQGLTAKIDSKNIRMGSADWLKINNQEPLHESQVHLEIDNVYKGYFYIQSAYRQGVFVILDELKRKYPLHLLSGDNDSEKSTLASYFDELHFNQKPIDKLEYLKKLPDQPLMVGDGLNDAGALTEAHVGFAVCEDIHQFSPACDAMVEAKSLKNLNQLLLFPKWTLKIITAAFILSFIYNAVGLSFAVSGNLSPVISAILMPLSSITVVGFITLAIHISAKKLFRTS